MPNAADRPGAEDLFGEDRVHDAARLGARIGQQVAEDDAGGHHGQRDGHVRHRPLGVGDLGLPQDLDAVGDGFDAGVGAGAEGVGAEDDEEGGEAADLTGRALGLPDRAEVDPRQVEQVLPHGDDDHEEVGGHEDEEDRNENLDALLDAAQVEHDEDTEDQHLEDESVSAPGDRQEAEDLVDPGSDRRRDRQDVVEDEGAARDHAEPGAEQLGRDEVSATAAGKELDDLAVAGRDDDDGRGDHEGEEHREVGVRAQRLERLLGTVRGGRQPVGAQPDPRQKGRERDGVKHPRIHRIPGLSDEDVLDCGGQGERPSGGADYVFGCPASQTPLRKNELRRSSLVHERAGSVTPGRMAQWRAVASGG